MKNFQVSLLALSIIVLGACNSSNKSTTNSTEGAKATEPTFVKEGELSFVKADKTVIKHIVIEKALTDSERMQGLMYRSTMADTCGMLFVFDIEEPQSFWMKNTILPLDIVYVNAKKEIVSIFKYAKPYSEQGMPSNKPAQYVVEVNAGFCDKYHIAEGDFVNFN